MITLPLERQDDYYMLSVQSLGELTGQPEYEVRVVSPMIRGTTLRQVCLVEDINGKSYWADTVTGTLYYPNGKCVSGPLHFDEAPVLSARLITPDNKVRRKEAEVRFLNRLARDEAYMEDE